MEQQEKIFSVIFEEDDITWQTIIYDLVKQGEIDPWNVDISALSNKYLKMLKKLKNLDFRVSGKVVLAAAILLKIKTNKLMGSDFSKFESLFKVDEEYIDDMDESSLEDHLDLLEQIKKEKPTLIPRTPQPRERKVTIFDLVDALNKSLKVRQRRITKDLDTVEIKAPQKTRDITEVIREVYGNLTNYFKSNKKNSVMFEEITPSNKKEDKIMTFIPLLHLTNQRKIDLEQEGHLTPIKIRLLRGENV